MKTTVEIPDLLFRRAQKHCLDRGISFGELIEIALRNAIDQPKATTAFRLKPFGFQGDGQIVQGWATIREVAYAGRGGAELQEDDQ